LTQPAAPGPNWWKRNWKWFVPLGCFTVALLFLAFVGSIVVIVFSAMKSTDVYKEALARAKADPAVIEAASGESNLAIPISGPKGKGTKVSAVQVSLIFFDGSWSECKKKLRGESRTATDSFFPRKESITRMGKQVERVVPWPAVALAKATQRVGNCGSAAWNLCANNALEKLAFGNSIVLRTRRSTLVPVYV